MTAPSPVGRSRHWLGAVLGGRGHGPRGRASRVRANYLAEGKRFPPVFARSFDRRPRLLKTPLLKANTYGHFTRAMAESTADRMTAILDESTGR